MTVNRTDRITILPATVEDAGLVHQLLTELEGSIGVEGGVRRSAADLARYGFSEHPFFEALIARNGESPVGLAVYFREFSTWRGSPGVYVQDLYVAGEARGYGLGRRLMDAVFDRARGWGATYCKLAVYGENTGAMAFYRQLGFRLSAQEQVLMLDGI
jgi:GNAT superfamily N-acetyltransferase